MFNPGFTYEQLMDTLVSRYGTVGRHTCVDMAKYHAVSALFAKHADDQFAAVATKGKHIDMESLLLHLREADDVLTLRVITLTQKLCGCRKCM